MNVYLVRHGKAEQGIPDDAARRLTEKGRKAVQRVAQRLAASGVQVDRIEHSGLARARETAEILATAVGGEVATAAGLAPDGAIEPVAQYLQAVEVESIMLVGHNPFMERMAAYLLTGDPEAGILHFRTGATACLSRDHGAWTLEWFISPDVG